MAGTLAKPAGRNRGASAKDRGKRSCRRRRRATRKATRRQDRSPCSRLTQELPRYTRRELRQALRPRKEPARERHSPPTAADPDYRQLTTHKYNDGGKRARSVHAQRATCSTQFREDVRTGQLPTVSWLVAPERFSDHPGSAWYGAWYIAEALNILTNNPDVWKKTVFILTYDENDGYFDHVPPFVAPHPRRPETGLVSAGIDTSLDYVDRNRTAMPGTCEKLDRPRLSRADDHRLALEPRRVRLLAGVRSHVRAAVPGAAADVTRPAAKSRSRTSAPGGGPFAAILPPPSRPTTARKAGCLPLPIKAKSSKEFTGQSLRTHLAASNA